MSFSNCSFLHIAHDKNDIPSLKFQRRYRGEPLTVEQKADFMHLLALNDSVIMTHVEDFFSNWHPTNGSSTTQSVRLPMGTDGDNNDPTPLFHDVPSGEPTD